MKKFRFLPLVAFVIGMPVMLFATPSTEFWTAGTTDIQGFGIGHIDIDDYFHVAKSTSDPYDAFPTDVGYTIGILPFSKVNMEIGIDLMGAGNFPVLFNGKAAIPEDAFFKGQPGIAVGSFYIGTKSNVTDFDVTYLNIGKTIPVIGRLFVGGYTANKSVEVGTDGVDQGITVAWDKSFLPAKSAGGVDYTRLTVCADIATGNNAYGAWGFGASYNFNENISILTGPLFPVDEEINGRWKWSTQLDVNFKNW